jgi:DNA-binding transcriptional LysR family regulator
MEEYAAAAFLDYAMFTMFSIASRNEDIAGMKHPEEQRAALLDVRLLRLFDVLYSTRSVTHAAEQLGQAQPTVSIWLGRLRRELRDPLFVRTPAGMEPTPRAEALIAAARSAIETLRSLTDQEQDFDPATVHRRFRICMTDASHVTLLPRLLARLRATAPNICIEALQIDANIASLLQSGDADLALGLIEELESGFYQQTLYAQDWVCLANPRHPRITGRLSLSRYQAEAHIRIVSGTGHKLLEGAISKQQVSRRVLLELPGFLGLAAIVLTTDLIATLPRHTGETLGKANGLQVFPCPVRIPAFAVKQHWHARYHHDAGNRWLRTVCAELFQQRIGRSAGEPAAAATGRRPHVPASQSRTTNRPDASTL